MQTVFSTRRATQVVLLLAAAVVTVEIRSDVRFIDTNNRFQSPVGLNTSIMQTTQHRSAFSALIIFFVTALLRDVAALKCFETNDNVSYVGSFKVGAKNMKFASF